MAARSGNEEKNRAHNLTIANLSYPAWSNVIYSQYDKKVNLD